MRRTSIFLALLVLVLALSACGIWRTTKKSAAKAYEFTFDTKATAEPITAQDEIPFIELNYDGADEIYDSVQRDELPNPSPVYVTPFVDSKKPDQPSLFGQVVSEYVAKRLVQDGLVITEGNPKATDYFPPPEPTKDQGLKASLGAYKPPRAALLTGSYVIAEDFVYVTAQVTRLDDKAVVAGHSWPVPITDNVRKLLPEIQRNEGLVPTVQTSF